MAENIDKRTDDILDSLLNKISPEYQAQVDYKMALAAKIYAGMKAKNWNKTQFAAIMKVKNSVVTKWLKGFHNFESDTLFNIQRVLNINLLNLEQENQVEQLETLTGTATNIQALLEGIDFNGGSRFGHDWRQTSENENKPVLNE